MFEMENRGELVEKIEDLVNRKRYTELRDLLLPMEPADIAILAEIYAARESNTIGISSADLAAQIPGSIYCETLQDVTDCLRSIVREGDIVLTMGAGDIFRAGEALLSGEDSKK